MSRSLKRHGLADALMMLLLTVMVLVAFATRSHAAEYETLQGFFSRQIEQGLDFRPQILRDAEQVVRHGYGVVKESAGAVVDAGSEVLHGSSHLVASAARFIGTNPTGWAHNWCAEFANRVLKANGYATSGSAMAASFAHYGPHVGPRPGAIAVLRGHVGFVESVLPGGRIVLVSGNGGRRRGAQGRVTTRSVYARSAFMAFVMPRPARFVSLNVNQY